MIARVGETWRTGINTELPPPQRNRSPAVTTITNKTTYQNRKTFRQCKNILVSFYARKQPCFQRVLAIAILFVRLSVRPSVRPSVTRVDQAKTVQARISKFSPSAAWKNLVSGTVKLSRKLEGGHPERGR